MPGAWAPPRRAVDDLLADLAGQHAELDSLLVGCGAIEWSQPSPCPGWDVADVVVHLHQTDLLALASLRGELGAAIEAVMGADAQAVDRAAAAARGERYFTDNPAYGDGDAAVLAAVLGRLRPRRVIELGCGYSSACMLDVREADLGEAFVKAALAMGPGLHGASINVGTQVPVLTSQLASPIQVGGTNSINQSISSHNTGVTLQVNARVNPSGIVTLIINQEISKPQANGTGNSLTPSFDQQVVQTQITMQDGDTIAIGGIIAENGTNSSQGVPALHKIPFLGAAFGSKSLPIATTATASIRATSIATGAATSTRGAPPPPRSRSTQGALAASTRRRSTPAASPRASRRGRSR